MINATELRDLMAFQMEFTTLRKHIEQQVIDSALTEVARWFAIWFAPMERAETP
jgi:hypothetical protein